MAASSADGNGEETHGGETPSETRSSTADMKTPRTCLACTDSKRASADRVLPYLIGHNQKHKRRRDEDVSCSSSELPQR